MKIIDKMLSLIGLQRKIDDKIYMKQIMKGDICDHKWFSTGDPYSRPHYDETTIYCPECGQEKFVSWDLKNRLIEARKIKQEYELNKQNNIDSLFQELTQK